MRCLSAAVVVLAAANGYAASIPFSDEFTGDTVGAAPSNFSVNFSSSGTGTGTRSGTAVVQAVGSDKVVRHTLSAQRTGGNSGVASIFSQAVQFSDSPGTTGADFLVTTQFTLNSFSATSGSDTVTVSVIALASGNTWGTNNDARYQLNYSLVGNSAANSPRLLLQESGGSGLDLRGTSTGTLAPVAGTTYTLSLTGTYAIPGDPTSDLLLEGLLTSSTGSLDVSFTDTSPRQGGFFGVRTGVNRAANGTASAQVDVTSFSVVPEPSVLVLGALGALSLLRRRR
jgi:hypothetical protein